MKIRITGINGYIGSMIASELQNSGHQVNGINRKLLYGEIFTLSEEIKGTDVIINLAGAPIVQRWTQKNKNEIYNSRVETTTNLVAAINQLTPDRRSKKFISASAIGLYKAGLSHNEESTRFDDGFLGTVVENWEKPLKSLPAGVQKVVLRIGLVIGKNAGTISKQLLPFKLGLGAKIGNGKQPFPFIHDKDLVNAFVWAAEEYENDNIFNMVAPENISNEEFTAAFARRLNRPAFLSVPEFILKLALGEAAGMLAQSPEVLSEKIQEAGFQFTYPDIESALKEILA